MPKKKPQPNRIWIELDRPESTEHAEVQCKLANRMLERLAAPETASRYFWYHESKGMYCLGDKASGMYTELGDRGEWFNLDYLGREE